MFNVKSNHTYGHRVLYTQNVMQLNAAFDFVCREKDYSNTGEIRELIRKQVKEELEGVKVSAKEWAEIEKGIKEIERGDLSTSFLTIL